jgi:hypothetical protein
MKPTITKPSGKSNMRLQPRVAQVMTLIASLLAFCLVSVPDVFAAGDATSPSCPQEAESAAGFRSWLPDCRGYEMVSPLSSNIAEIYAISGGAGSFAGGAIQASEDGESITYAADRTLLPDVTGAGEEDRMLSTRTSGGWSSVDISPPHEAATSATGYPEYQMFSPDLSVGVLETQPGVGALSPGATPEAMIYLRSDGGSYEPVLPAENSAPSAKLDAAETGGDSLEGASPDVNHVVFNSGEALTATAVRKEFANHVSDLVPSLYEWSSGQLQLVSILPASKGDSPADAISETSSYLGAGGPGETGDVRHAVSADGSKVFWETEEQGVGIHGETSRVLYMRDTATQSTTEVDAPQGGTPTGLEREAQFQLASQNGSQVFFTDGQPLTPRSKAGGDEDQDLYDFDTETGVLSDVTEELANPGESADVRGAVIGANEEGSQVYFVARGVLRGSGMNAQGRTAVAGRDNLYMSYEDVGRWSSRFIASLAPEDGPDWDGGREGEGDEHFTLRNLTSRVSPDGRYLAFMSVEPLTGYDSEDVTSETPGERLDEEVYLYDSSSGRLMCASCNPSGARPAGVYDTGGLLVDRTAESFRGDWLAGSVPGWTGEDNGAKAFYQSRYLDDNGRLFFMSPDALVSQDTNGKEDVYEYEPEAIGSCDGTSASFSQRAAGCVSLISSGTGREESAFLDASASGNDVFFLTGSRLSSQDQSEDPEVYDAHVCSTESPCPPVAATPPPACAATETCRPGVPSPPVFGVPSSTTLAGGLTPVAPPTPVGGAKPRPLTKAQKLAAVLKACRRDKSKKKRASCAKRARHRYGEKANTKKAARSIHAGGRRES